MLFRSADAGDSSAREKRGDPADAGEQSSGKGMQSCRAAVRVSPADAETVCEADPSAVDATSRSSVSQIH